MIGVPDCNDEKVIWLKRPFEIPTTATTTIIPTQTTRPTAEAEKTHNEEYEPAKYVFFQIQR